MSSRTRNRGAVEEAYGFPFPDDVFDVADFARAHPSALEALEVTLDGPFALLLGDPRAHGKAWDPGGGWPRFHGDPPEFFTVMMGPSDGMHWGYWFDDPGVLPPVVASYNHSEGVFIRPAGETVFEALRARLERCVVEAEDDETREELAKARQDLGGYTLAERTQTGAGYLERWGSPAAASPHRKPIAPTRTGMGIVVAKKDYRPLHPGDDPFASPSFKPDASDVARWVGEAKEALESGYPGTGLKLGHDLWATAAFADESYDLLDRTYGALGRRVLRDYLARAIHFRKQSK